MKVSQLRDIFNSVERLYRAAGNDEAANSFKEISALCEGHDKITVAAFAVMIEKAEFGAPGSSQSWRRVP